MNGFGILGGIFLLISGWTSALWLNQRAECRLLRVEAFLSLLRYTKTQVDCYLLSAPELFARCDPQLLIDCGLDEGKIPTSFEDFAQSCGKEDGEAWEMIRKFSASFGKQYRREQVGECEYYIEQLEKRRGRLAKSMPEGKRLRFTMCMTVAAVAVILLL